MTTPIDAFNRPSATASISACKLVPRPEINTPRRRLIGSEVTGREEVRPHLEVRVDHRRNLTRHDLADDTRITTSTRCKLPNQRLGVIARGHDNQANTHVKR